MRLVQSFLENLKEGFVEQAGRSGYCPANIELRTISRITNDWKDCTALYIRLMYDIFRLLEKVQAYFTELVRFLGDIEWRGGYFGVRFGLITAF